MPSLLPTPHDCTETGNNQGQETLTDQKDRVAPRKAKRGSPLVEPGTARWARVVNLRLGQGYGVEDIALQLGCGVDWVRAHVRVARDHGFLPKILGRAK